MRIDRRQVVLHIADRVLQLAHREFVKVAVMQSVDHIANLHQRVDQFVALPFTPPHSPHNRIHLLQVGEHGQHTLHVHRRGLLRHCREGVLGGAEQQRVLHRL